ncbi:hypothetical protein [Vibrio barjaei]|uniref:hypothetical protein n=1 Tax=Vibrio barjaei TaxID=1676683 RepID=UPI0022852985|nr:hypothetical protein [Vibrio barjaei]MCY9872354.1 hypothetical protein [Vibrio barjaei]
MLDGKTYQFKKNGYNCFGVYREGDDVVPDVFFCNDTAICVASEAVQISRLYTAQEIEQTSSTIAIDKLKVSDAKGEDLAFTWSDDTAHLDGCLVSVEQQRNDDALKSNLAIKERVVQDGYILIRRIINQSVFRVNSRLAGEVAEALHSIPMANDSFKYEITIEALENLHAKHPLDQSIEALLTAMRATKSH